MTIIGKTGQDAFAPKKKTTEKQPPVVVSKEFKKGDKVAIAVHGAGVVSYEPHTVEKIRNGVVYLEGNDDFVFDSKTGRRTCCEPSPFGFSFQLVPKSEVPQDGPSGWKQRCKDFGMEP